MAMTFLLSLQCLGGASTVISSKNWVTVVALRDMGHRVGQCLSDSLSPQCKDLRSLLVSVIITLCKAKSHCVVSPECLSSYSTVTCPNTFTSQTECSVNSMKAFLMFGMDYCP